MPTKPPGFHEERRVLWEHYRKGVRPHQPAPPCRTADSGPIPSLLWKPLRRFRRSHLSHSSDCAGTGGLAVVVVALLVIPGTRYSRGFAGSCCFQVTCIHSRHLYESQMTLALAFQAHLPVGLYTARNTAGRTVVRHDGGRLHRRRRFSLRTPPQFRHYRTYCPQQTSAQSGRMPQVV